jgi:xanthine/CO dehydrogenase XdhC/CoxF family maturation factor
VKDILEDVTRWTERGDRLATATVVDFKRSAPRAPGSKMAINEHGDVSGQVSGGCVEGAVVEEALMAIGDGKPRLLDFGVSDEQAWEVGLACGGKIEIFVERVE